MAEHVTGTAGSPLHALAAEGVSPWLDGPSRARPARAAEGVRGAVSDPAALAADAAGDDGCREQLRHLAQRSAAPDTAVLALCAYDLRSACDALRPVFDASHGLDGHASMDLDARLLHDPGATAAAAAELHRAALRDNALVKVPATAAGLAAARVCLERGVGTHLTEVFSVRRHGDALDACLDGLDRARAAGRDLARVPVCVSFAVGPLEDAVDARLAALGTAEADALRGTAAQAAARLAYRAYEERLAGDRWRTLARAGARPPRLLWHVGGDRADADGTARVLRRVESLVAWGTGVALPAAGLDAVARAGRLRGDTLTDRHGPARAVLARLERLGVSVDGTAAALAARRLARLTAAWAALRTSVTQQLRPAGAPAPARRGHDGRG
ncbi:MULTISPECIES: transaldolase family protein [Streptomyces]|uniref:transaldolase family protein n=1 Tax=Streptomyces TaxID=1883 RepID=UPI00163D20DB|nr:MULTISPECIES: transaldolase family protein [Streptomyces]MBC2876723.1 transaldolase [Streptomyces sp. TYQ1024]UBI36352.1 transaldolase [Streptomyces mobaraensis]UKW28946.1 transaldolase [Streptomyces sp. TYQ1024]